MSLTVTVQKDWLLGKLQENRAKHEAEYQEAYKGWLVTIQEELQDKLDSFAEDGSLTGEWHPQFSYEPSEYLNQYDQVIGMLEIADDESFTINTGQYENWVKDQWGWKDSFTTSNLLYAGKA